VPSLDLRFADSKSLVDATTGSNLVTFTRASSGTFVGSDGVIRTAVTNLLLRSEEFDNASWIKLAATVTSNAIAAPNGANTADLLTEDGTTNAHNAAINTVVTNGVLCTFSVYAKRNGRDLQLLFGGSDVSGNPYVNFDLANGTVASTSGTITGAVQAIGDGWYRCSVTATSAVSADFTCVCGLITSTSAGRAESYAGDSTSGIYLWGAQLEQSSSVGEYIPTTSTINSAPRFDHNPTTGESLGLLVEEQRANLLVQSNGFDTTWTNTTSSETAASGTAPDGTNTAWELKDTVDGGAVAHALQQTISFTSGTAYTFTVFAKQGTQPNCALLFPSGQFGTANARFNLSAGTVVIANGVTATITAFANSWYRCAITATATSTASGAVLIRTDNGSTSVYQGDGTGTILVWGAQLEAGAFPTSYIPTTTTATVTRSADVCSISGSNFSSWYRQDEGTVFADANSPTSGTHVTFDDGTVNTNRVVLYYQSVTDPRLFVASAGATSCIISAGTITSNSRALMVGAYKLNDFAASVNGASPVLDASGNAPTAVDRARLGRSSGDGGYLNGCLRRVTYWPQRLPNSTLQAVTQ
jgi:hypothetical protein